MREVYLNTYFHANELEKGVKSAIVTIAITLERKKSKTSLKWTLWKQSLWCPL